MLEVNPDYLCYLSLKGFFFFFREHPVSIEASGNFPWTLDCFKLARAPQLVKHFSYLFFFS